MTVPNLTWFLSSNKQNHFLEFSITWRIHLPERHFDQIDRNSRNLKPTETNFNQNTNTYLRREAYKALFIRSPKTFYSHSQARSCTVRGGGLSETVPRPGHPALGSRQASGSNVGDQTGDDPVINCDVIH